MAIQLAITLLWILGAAQLVVGQDESAPTVPLLAADSDRTTTPTSDVREGLIHLDVSIADRTGKAVGGLTPSDFTLLDNGEPVPIISLHSSDPAYENGRLTEVAVVLDDLDSRAFMFAQARSDLIKYLRQNDGRLAQPTSVYWLTSIGFYASARPTIDGNQLVADVERNSWPRAIWLRPPGSDLAAFASSDNWSKALRSVYSLAVNWSEKPGRKVLVWIGPGWPIDDSISISGGLFPLLVELLTRIRDARMVIYQASSWAETNHDFAYTLYAAGVRSSSKLKAATRYFSLPVLALESGGMVLDEGFSVADDIARSVRDAGSFYTLSFDPPHAARVDEYRDLKVGVAKPGFAVRTTIGYYNQPDFYDQPRIPAEHVTVQQLESTLQQDDKDHDGELAEQLNAMELTERMSSSELASWLKQIRGRRSRAALTVLADASVFLAPRAAEIPLDPPPDHNSQVQMLTRTVQYVNQMLPKLPDFYAIRTLVEYAQRVPDESSWKTAATDQSLYEWVTERSTLLYRNGREEQVIHKRKAKKSLQRDINFTGIFGPILHQVLDDATAGGNGLAWSRWQRSEQGDEAVFCYSTQSDHQSLEIVHCCLRNNDTFRTDPQYHGELTIDPQTGAILRLTIQSEPGWIVEPNLAPVRPVRATGMMVEYGPVRIGGKAYICPERSVVTTRTRFVKPLNFWGQDSTVYSPYETMMDDIVFSDYHKFGSESRILPGFEVVQDEKPQGNTASPKTTVSH